MGGSLAGLVLDGRWSLTARIASGSFASVYRALDLESGVERAVKILTEVATPEAVQRFRAEFETLRRLTHPHVVRCHAVGTVSGRPYMVLDLVAGGNVTVLLDDGPVGADRAATIGVEVLAGLATAHARGVIHRDVKPGNVLVDEHGGALVCDFGIARIESADQTRLTQVGASLGTLLYMAPEQRLDAHAVDLTADLYGVGCLLYRLLTDESPADLFAAGPASPRWAPVPEHLRPVLIKATRGRPEERYPDARAMAEALLAVLPTEARIAIEARPACDPRDFPVPDPKVRVGTFMDDPTMPGEPRVPPKKKKEGPRVVARARPRPPSPWPWRIGVAVLAVVVMGVAGMMLGACAPAGKAVGAEPGDTGDSGGADAGGTDTADTGDTGDTDTADTGDTDPADTGDTADTGPVGSLACPPRPPPVDTGVEDCDNGEDDDGDGLADGEDLSCPLAGRIDADAASADWVPMDLLDHAPHRYPDGSLALVGEQDGWVSWYDLCDAMEGAHTRIARVPTGQPRTYTVFDLVDLTDVEGDGAADLLVGHSTPYEWELLRFPGPPTTLERYDEAVLYLAETRHAVLLDDFDADGLDDLLLAHAGIGLEPQLSWVSSAVTGEHDTPHAVAERTLRVFRNVEVGYATAYMPHRFERIDTDGDGVDEILVVVSAQRDDAWLQTGAAFLVSQSPGEGSVGEEAEAALRGDEVERLVDARSVRDLDGDGHTDLIATYERDGSRDTRTLELFRGPHAGIRVAGDGDATYPDYGSATPAGAGDVDGDGELELALTMTGGAAYVLAGAGDGAGPDDVVFYVPARRDFVGPWRMYDLDGDGLDDLVGGSVFFGR